MNKVYENKYMAIFINEEKSLIEIRRSDDTAYQTDEEYQSDILNWIDAVKKYKPSKQLIDERNMRYLITPEMQKWVNETLITPAVKISICKSAILVSQEDFAQLSVEQTMQEYTGNTLVYMYFADKEQAYKWLFAENTTQR